jgi:sulfur-oxidizing protein SoxX
MKKQITVLAVAAVIAGAGALPSSGADEMHKAYPEPATLDGMMKAAWKNIPAEEYKIRLEQDETQTTCSLYRNQPPKDVADKIMAREKAAVVFPADGKVIGDWKKGLKVASNGKGGQFSDKPRTVNGGNCYACHQLDKAEVSFGTLGPSLTAYGKLKNYAPEAAKDTYAKIYNSQSVVACSNMPRFGSHKFLTEEQIKDAVALLFDPESPVNK